MSTENKIECTNLIKIKRVKELTTLSFPSIYRLAKSDANFPKPFKIAERSSVWSEEEVLNYIAMCKDGKA